MDTTTLLKGNAMLWSSPFRSADLDSLLYACYQTKASDVTLQADQPVFAEIEGLLQPVTQEAVASHQITDILQDIYGSNAPAQLSRSDLDFSYEIKPSRSERVRFRVNATGILSRGCDACQITFRILPEYIPSLEEIELEEEIVTACRQKQGLILVTGPTGSGKTTLLASIIRHRLEHEQGGKILTYESPIEYVYDGLAGQHSLISQTEIPRHLPTYARAIRNALRRKPEVIVCGEARDGETITGIMEAALTGHLVFSTTHTNGVAETLPRLLSAFPSSEKTMRAWDLMESLRLIISQVLVPRQGGGRCALREWIGVDESLRKALLNKPVEQWTSEVRTILNYRKSSFKDAAQRAWKAEKIESEVYESFLPPKGEV